ncbi:TonB-dependent hemoglobin/transferrin/lactoferrin receptor:TonB-dependent hem/hemoglobin receptor [Shewanella piezotolerans WP3]|uniref:TonB-dependent hemoglobin/transferrin/lactoferrin receptor:TonB-dependent hem/hemoglobin receptor n=1 Tax=Shewanella piezotolerans (strain WP3 / JCM 13877) TaxID=225849 RepID=B8CSM2_SHEPW|nr:TonB-dependent hemoglobin/transferrin/lactoferrin family receptor [Shewanella piezotolerans]ACJ30648.1 TonB-dependent hemoglobin/transferrin/lactoferrin receptor:TonB-dependent hem/hemoglobin receptor [Shewanella piezotolerans WP3]
MTKKPLVIAMAMAFSSSVYAQDTQKVTEFDEVVVSATRVAEKVSETSRSVAVVNEEQLQEFQPASVAQALKNEANVNVSNGPRASSQGVEIRGLGGQRVLQTIDGARQNTNSGHRGTYFIDPELLSSVEVLRGPASSLWGSGAIGGVVAQNTKSASDFLEDEDTFGGYLKQGFESNGDRIKTSGAIYGLSETANTGTVDWLINGSYYDSNNIKVGNDKTLENSASEGTSGLAKFGWQPTDEQRLQLSARFSKIDELVPSNPSTEVGSSVPLVKRKTNDQNVTLDYSFNPEMNPLLDLNATLYWNGTDYDEDRVTKNQVDSTEYNTLGFSINNSSKFANTILTYGVDGYQDTIKTVRDDSGQAGQRPDDIDGETAVWGAFTRADISLSDNWKLDAAVRYDAFKNTSNNLNQESDDSAFSPSLGLVWTATDWLTLSARFDQAFRAPSIEEMYSTGTHYCIPPIPGFLPGGLCNTFEINPDLQAEKAQNKEIKADLRFSELAGDDELAMTLSVFRNDVDDFIEQSVSDPLMGIPGFEQTTSWNNVDEAKLTGFEFSTRYRYEQTRLSLNYGQTEGKDKTEGDYLTNIPAKKLGIDLSQAIMEGDMKFGTRFTYVAEQDQLPQDYTNQYDSYKLWDVYVAWEPAMGTFEGLRVDFAVENIGDEEYRQAWQTLYEQGRNVKLSARYSF